MKRAMSHLAAALMWLGAAISVHAEDVDVALVNGKIVTLDERGSIAEALAVRDGKIIAVGRSADIRALAGATTRIVDVGGRTVVPGLVDSHMHAIRAALFYATEVNWIGTRSIPEAMARIAAAAKEAKPGQWIIVAGGWTDQQFAEHRRPTQAELVAAAPDHPVYIQSFYSAALLSPAGLKTLAIANDADVPPRGKIERDAAGNPTGWISGDNATITALFDRLPLPTFDDSVAGTKAFFRELNRLGLTGVSDPGGFNLTAASYLPLFKVWRDHALTVRVVFSLFSQRPGKELEDYQTLTQMLPMGFGDDMLRFNGIGENVTWGMYNNDNPTPAQKQQYYEVARWAASRGMTLTQHWSNDVSVHHLLDVMERVNRETPIAPLRWSIAHLNDASGEDLTRMKALGVMPCISTAMASSRLAAATPRGARRQSRPRRTSASPLAPAPTPTA
jgi:predicted amidohydrolase YtcJ